MEEKPEQTQPAAEAHVIPWRITQTSVQRLHILPYYPNQLCGVAFKRSGNEKTNQGKGRHEVLGATSAQANRGGSATARTAGAQGRQDPEGAEPGGPGQAKRRPRSNPPTDGRTWRSPAFPRNPRSGGFQSPRSHYPQGAGR